MGGVSVVVSAEAMTSELEFNIERNNTYPRLTLPGVSSGIEFRSGACKCVFLPNSIVDANCRDIVKTCGTGGLERIIVESRCTFGLLSHGQSRTATRRTSVS